MSQFESALGKAAETLPNAKGEGDIYFNEHVIKPGEELRLPMAPIPPIGWAGTLNDLVIDESAKKKFDLFWNNIKSSPPKVYQRIDKIAKY